MPSVVRLTVSYYEAVNLTGASSYRSHDSASHREWFLLQIYRIMVLNTNLSIEWCFANIQLHHLCLCVYVVR